MKFRYLVSLISCGLFMLLIGSQISPVLAQSAEEIHDEQEEDHEHNEELQQAIESLAIGGENEEELEELKRTIDELQKKIGELKTEQSSLSNTIAVLNSQIQLNEKEIQKTEKEISILEHEIVELTDRIAGLEISLDELSQLLVQRIRHQYKQSQIDPVAMFFASTGLTEFVKEQQYIQKARAHTEDLMVATEYKRQVYDEEKDRKEQKQAEVEVLRNKLATQQQSLNTQRVDKQRLLDVTRNDEKVYQQKLASALAEYQAIQSIVAGKGSETKVGDVKKGDLIASIIPGPSTCSTGAHLHFEVVKNGAHVNPAGYLKSTDVTWNDDSFSFGGDWDWPVDNPAVINQGYGMTSFARSGFYGGGGHTGIDMNSKTRGDWDLRAVSDGELYRGSVRCGGGNLRYVRVKHNGEISTYYLHVNY